METQLVEASRPIGRCELGSRVHGARVAVGLTPAQVVDAHLLNGQGAVARGEVVGALPAAETSGKAA